ncbi:MAG: hypothetical protein H0V81_00360 [Solirubrobacterales bacterium]|nr:hypothetical protein [Solirubrobacterales bacterium]
MSHLEDTIIAIRLADESDAQSLTRLAGLDSARVPEDPLLLGLLDGRVVVALSLSAGTVIADPFTPTLDLVALVRQRSERLGVGAAASSTRRRWSSMRPALGRLA